MILLHIIEQGNWNRVGLEGQYAPASLAREGFIHFSQPEQIAFVANTFYRNKQGLSLLVIDSEKLTAPLRFEAVPEHGTFPHLYGPLNVDAVVTVVPFEPDAHGAFTLPEGIAGA
jgi:uncharacterized protein (DUF952 family)